jgi:hypothetical protein
MSRALTAAAALASCAISTLTCACSPPAVNVPPKLAVSSVDKGASEIDMRMDDAGLMENSAELVLDSVTTSMNESVGGTRGADAKPARFRMRLHHDQHAYAGMIVLIALPIIDLITMPIISASGADVGRCDEQGSVDVQIGASFYHADIDMTDQGYAFGPDVLTSCMHKVMQVALDTMKPVPRPPAPRSEP